MPAKNQRAIPIAPALPGRVLALDIHQRGMGPLMNFSLAEYGLGS